MPKKYTDHITKGETGDHYYTFDSLGRFHCVEVNLVKHSWQGYNNTYYKGYNIGYAYSDNLLETGIHYKRELFDVIDKIESSPILKKLYKRA